VASEVIERTAPARWAYDASRTVPATGIRERQDPRGLGCWARPVPKRAVSAVAKEELRNQAVLARPQGAERG